MTTAVEPKVAAGDVGLRRSPSCAMRVAAGMSKASPLSLLARNNRALPRAHLHKALSYINEMYFPERRYLVKKNLDGYIPIQQRAATVPKPHPAPKLARSRSKTPNLTLTAALKCKRVAPKR